MKIHSRIAKVGVLVTLLASVAGCTAWDGMTSRQKGAVSGAGVGGLAGAVITDGGVLGTIGGAALGGLIGDQIGKNSN